MPSLRKPRLLFPLNQDLPLIAGARRDGRQAVNFLSTVQQYGSSDESSMSKADRQALQRNRDGIARIVVGGNESHDRSARGVTLVGDNQGTLDRGKSSLGRSSRSGGRVKVTGDGSLRRLGQSMAVRQSGDGSTSPPGLREQKMRHGTPIREEAFRPASPTRQKGILRLPADRRRDESPQRHDSGRQVVIGDGYGSGRRRKGQYNSILEYEKQQSGGKRGLALKSGSENIAPQNMTLILDGNHYSIENQKKGSLGRRSGRPERPATAPVTGLPGRHNALQVISNGAFNEPLSATAVIPVQGEGRIMVRNNQITTPQHHDIQPQQLSNQIVPYRDGTVSVSPPKYKVQQRGKGDNFMKNEALEVDDDHKFYRQHGQRVKLTDDGGEKRYLDQRLAETKDVIGDQMVSAQHAQKVHSGETVGANHRTKFHSETKVSHQVSHPVNTPGQGQSGAGRFPVTSALVPQAGGEKGLGRQNSQPVQVTTHQWPALEQFDHSGKPGGGRVFFNYPADMNTNFHNNFGMGMGQGGMQRFYKPEYNPRPQVQFNPGFQRFFESIKNFGPHSTKPVPDSPRADQEKKLALTATGQKSVTSPVVELAGDNASETSSIRSSASAYWPPELRLASSETEQSDANSWEFHKPMMQLRRKNVGMPKKHHHLRLIK